MIEAGYQNKVIHVGNLKSLRTVADVRDAVEAYYLLVTRKPRYGETYNIGGKFTCTIKEILNFLIKSSKVKGIKIKLDKKRFRPIDADLQIPDTKKFTKHTNWRPKYKFNQTMIDLLNYWRQKVRSGSLLIDENFKTKLKDVMKIRLKAFKDHRGKYLETFNKNYLKKRKKN